jgi:phytoene/squalene synthetase
MISLYHNVCHECSELVTRRYSTSFSSAIRLLHRDLRKPIFDVYGFVRFADEIVDTFHEQDKAKLLDRFCKDTWEALELRFSLNPILHSFQHAVHTYNIGYDLIEAFMHSMRLDLSKSMYEDESELDEYIYGSAEVVGLMCLCVFCEGDTKLYESLKHAARKLGAAFQKINFLRDIQADHQDLQRTYFPGFDYSNFTEEAKQQIESNVAADFKESLPGIRALPVKARYGVYTAYRYYYTLFEKIKRTKPKIILQSRVRVPNYEKIYIMAKAQMRYKLNMI